MKSLSLLLLIIAFLNIRILSQQEFIDSESIDFNKLKMITSSLPANIDENNLDSLISTAMETYHIPGLAALVIKNNSIVWSNNYGYANVSLNKPVEDSTLFMMASISKTITITALMQLWEDGLFDLEDNINDYLQPDFQIHHPNYPNDTITFKMLMTHTSSIDDNWNVLTPLTCCDDSPILLDYFLANYFTPGGNYYNSTNFLNSSPSDTVWEYTNVGSSILAFIVEKLSGVSFPQYCEDNIFTPLDMHLSSWFLEGMDTSHIATLYELIGNQYVANCHQGWPPYPAAYLKTNKIELEHFLSAYMNGGSYNGYTLLNSATIDTMLQVYKYADPYNSWGLIWFRILLNDRYLWGHTGGWTYGTNTFMFFHPTEDWGFLMFMNIYHPDAFWYINGIISEYAHLYGNVYAINTKLNKTYIRPDYDTIMVRTEFSNVYQHDFLANAVFISSDGVFIDSTALYDDGLHADSLANDGIWGGFINPISEEEIFKVGISTLNIQNNTYFFIEDLVRFTTAGPVVVDSATITYNSVAKIYQVKPHLRNGGNSFTVENLKISMMSSDTTITYISGPLNVASIAPGETVIPAGSYTVRIDSNFSLPFNFNFNISSDEWLYWKDSISIVTSVEGENTLPISYKLFQNYPNPFNPTTTIKYGISERTFVELRVYDILGKEIALLVNEEQKAGYYELNFNQINLPSGVYFYQLRAGNFVETKKMVLMK